MTTLDLYNKLEKLPKGLKEEVDDFIDFVVKRTLEKQKKIVPKFGSAKGKIKLSSDFDKPLDDFKKYM